MMKICMIIPVVFLFSFAGVSQDHPGSVDTQLYLGESDNQPLVVAFGGGEGGNAWSSDRVKDKRNKLVEKGYAVLAVGYFGTENSPEVLDRISLDAIHDRIVAIARNPRIDEKRIALIGVSKGAELALLLASHFDDITCVVAMVPSHCSFPAHTATASTSSWSIGGEEVPFVPMKMEAVPALMKHDLYTAFSIMLEDTAAVEKASIAVEKINGPVFLLSAKQDEQWPSTEMSNAVMDRLRRNQFTHTYEHLAIEGDHSEVFDHFDSIYLFLEQNFPVD